MPNDSIPTVDETLKTPQAAPVVGVEAETLRAWRRKGRGPAYIKAGKLVLYRRSDLDAWLNANRVEPEAS